MFREHQPLPLSIKDKGPLKSPSKDQMFGSYTLTSSNIQLIIKIKILIKLMLTNASFCSRTLWQKSTIDFYLKIHFHHEEKMLLVRNDYCRPKYTRLVIFKERYFLLSIGCFV